MIVEKEVKKAERKIFLDEPEGNAFNLLSVAKRTAEQLGLNGKEITKRMMSGDYEHLIQTFDKYFGAIYTLVRQKE